MIVLLAELPQGSDIRRRGDEANVRLRAERQPQIIYAETLQGGCHHRRFGEQADRGNCRTGERRVDFGRRNQPFPGECCPPGYHRSRNSGSPPTFWRDRPPPSVLAYGVSELPPIRRIMRCPRADRYLVHELGLIGHRPEQQGQRANQRDAEGRKLHAEHGRAAGEAQATSAANVPITTRTRNVRLRGSKMHNKTCAATTAESNGECQSDVTQFHAEKAKSGAWSRSVSARFDVGVVEDRVKGIPAHEHGMVIG